MSHPPKIAFSCRRDRDWLAGTLLAIASAGYAIVEDVLEPAFIDDCRAAMYRVQQAITADIGRDRLDRAGEVGVLRLMLKYDALFHRFLEIPGLQQIDYVRAVGDAAVQAQAPRTQQLLGWYTRVVTSLDEYYQPPDKRLYRSRQG